jgi:hypothetical protein
MRKLTTKLLMSIIAVAFAFVALGTSTYAWFAMNTTVEANTMTVNAKSDSNYLLINKDSTLTTIQSNKKIADNYSINDTKVYPVAYADEQKTIYLEGRTSASDDAESYKKDIAAGTWYTLSNKNTDNATNYLMNYKEQKTLTGYVVTYTFYLALSKDSATAHNGYLTLGFSLGQDDDAAVSAVVKIYSPNADASKADLLETSKVLSTSNTTYTTTSKVAISNDTVTKVEVQVFIDGNSNNVYSDYINGTDSVAAKEIKGNAVVTFTLVD